jgi:molecular chaperone DnaK
VIEDIVGIDLGTTNSEIAVYRAGRPEVLADERGRKILPSLVGVGETGELLVGEDARNQFGMRMTGWCIVEQKLKPQP